MEEHLESAKQKLLDALEHWCISYKLIGSKGETPRYSQVLNDLDEYDGKLFYLKSTVSRIRYSLNLTKEESIALLQMDTYKRWAWWKEIRTKHLIDNHPTINPY
jgi:hypothetical protein